MSRRWLGALGLNSLAGQLVVVMLLALLAVQTASLVLFAGDRRAMLRAVRQENVIERTAQVARALSAVPPELRDTVLAAASSARLRFALDDRDRSRDVPDLRTSIRLRDVLLGELRDLGVREARVAFRFEQPSAWQRLVELVDPPAPPRWRARPRDDHHDHERYRADDRPPHLQPPAGRPQIFAAVRLGPDAWLNARIQVSLPPPVLVRPAVLMTLGVAALVAVVVVLLVRRMTRPLAALAGAADAVGRGESPPPLPERGPGDVARASAAFNRMAERLRRYLDSRTRMLAAISHDLRTPITSLRLRAEFVDDEENRARMLATLDEMQRIAEAALDFAREEAAEDSRPVDLAALLQSLADDLAGLGWEVTCQAPERAPVQCRPTSLRRALRNLIGNAVSYGQRARVSLARDGADWRIDIDDDGPGIPEADRERVFEPFVRLEASRSRDTGGVGLGLSIARTVARAHGGDITLANRPEGGLRVSLRLPA
jgi:signal transduction histidine kinase